jgi:uncharacterized NAD(P)/FAD-binding protein YdhS
MGEDVRPRIAVIGTGMGAVMLLSALAEAGGPPQELWLLDKAPLSSEAYTAAAPEHILNTRARAMGLTAATLDGFARFAASQLGGAETETASAFLPRRLYARFLSEGLERALSALKAQGWAVRRRREEALGARREAGVWTIDTDRGRLRADRLVLAIGPHRFDRFPFAVSPWALSGAAAKASRILIIGAGLTAADAAVRLVALGHQGALILASPGPGLPLAQSHEPQPPALIAPPQPTQSPSALLGGVRRSLAAAAAAGADWRAGMDALRAQTPSLWAALPAAARRRLLQSNRLLAWSRHRHRLPPQTAETIAALQAAGRLSFLRDRVTATIEGGVVFARAGPAIFDLVVDARGFDISFARNALVKRLIATGAARACPTGFGLAPDARLQVGEDVYAMGAMLSGALLETTAAPEIRDQAGRIAVCLIQDAFTRASCLPRR